MAAKFMNGVEINKVVRERFSPGQDARVQRMTSSRSWMLTALMALVFAGGVAQADIPQDKMGKTATDTLILETDGWDVPASGIDLEKTLVSPPENASMTVLYSEKEWAPACDMSGAEMFGALMSGELCVSRSRLCDMEQLDELSYVALGTILGEEFGSPAMQVKMEALEGRTLEQMRNILVRPETRVATSTPVLAPSPK